MIHLDAATVTKDGANFVTSWTDLSTQGNNLTAPGGNQPTWISGALNGKPVIRFDGTTSYLSTTTLPVTGNSPFTILMVVTYQSIANGLPYSIPLGLGYDDAADGEEFYFGALKTDNFLHTGWGSGYTTDVVTSANAIGNTYLIEAVYDAASMR